MADTDTPRTGWSVFSLSGKKTGVRVYILPTKYGLAFMMVLLGLLIGSVNYANNLAFMMTFLLASTAFVSLIHTNRNLSGLSAPEIRGHDAFAGEDAVFDLSLTAGDRARWSLGFKLDDGPAAYTDLPAGRPAGIRVRLAAPQRGLLRPGVLHVWSRFPLGLFRAWAEFPAKASAVVYPHPLAGRVEPALAPGDGIDDGGGRPVAGVDDFKDIRPYRPGDPLPRLAWKHSSRGQGLMTKEFQGMAGVSAYLDWDRSGAGEVETRLSRLCTLVLRMEASGGTYGLRLPGRTIPPARGKHHRRECLTALALFGLAPEED